MDSWERDGNPGDDEDLLAYLRELGATPEQIATAALSDSVPGLAADLLLADAGDLTAAELARRVGTDEATVRQVFGWLGINPANLDDVLTVEDEAIVRLALRGREQPGMA
ncbi:MAG TPA: hypothetical protein VF855_09875, partial [Acidimicrobiales bacterium]